MRRIYHKKDNEAVSQISQIKQKSTYESSVEESKISNISTNTTEQIEYKMKFINYNNINGYTEYLVKVIGP